MDLFREELTKTNDMQMKYDALDDEDDEIRAIAVRQIGFSRDPTGVSYLTNHLLDPSLNVRSEIICALDRLGAPAEIALLNILNKYPDPELQASAVKALGHFGSKAVIEVLCNTIKSQEPRVRRAIITSLEKIGIVNTEIENVLIESLNDPDIDVVNAAIRAAGSLGVERAVPCLLEHINNSDERVQYNSIFAVGKIGSVHAVIPLISLMQSTDNDHLQIQIVNALAYIRDPLATEPLIQLLTKEDHDTRGRATERGRKSSHIRHCLATIGGPAVRPLIDLIRREAAKMPKPGIYERHSYWDNKIFTDIERVLADIRGPVVVAALINLLKDDDCVLRGWSCAVLGDISDNKALPSLITSVIKDPSRDVREAAGSALQNYMPVTVFEPLVGEMKKSNKSNLNEAKWVIECIVKNSVGKISDSLFCDDPVKESSTGAIFRNVIACSAAIYEEEDLDNPLSLRRTGIRRRSRCRFTA